MILKIHGTAFTTCTKRVVLICKEKQIPYELHPVNLQKGEHKLPPHTDFQPFGQVPYIDDDGFILYESRAICRYLAKKYADQGTPGLVPTDPQAEALFEQGVSIELQSFDPYAVGICVEKVFNGYRGIPTNEERVQELLEKLRAKIDVYEVILGKQKYIGGNQLTLADLFHIPYAFLMQSVGFEVVFVNDSHPNVARWWTEISSRPAWLAVKDGAA
ncbi:glutathione S-transferase-like protein [Hygrophoropsis aurantiaca]|uniref:Glutathione S-transferase-like protein n=1 Tax=Hygrophoropsis aurantiaca TaxID=72124 RepID=A0ACB8AJU1_9AGAM|nr:glutathione S-transferase-like protein [Hygrophoropsis aurantiaca]